ncbi:MAG: hypothetical protein MJ016_00820 [Victivallaceae bacterium]|nr:hypothetical protein [Victivallaceae bacterium]
MMMCDERLLNGGQLFAFSAADGVTDHTDGLVGRIRADILELKLPCDGGALIFPGTLDGVYGDCFTAGQTRGVLADAHHLLIEGDFTPVGVPGSYTLKIRGGRAILAVGKFFDETWFDADFDALFAARRKWLDAIDTHDNAVLKRAFSQLKTQICSPIPTVSHVWTTPDRWPHRNLWLWDSVFHAIGLRHVDPALAKEAIRAVFCAQDKTSGFIPHMTTADGFSKITQPPVLGYGIAKILEKDDDTDFLAEVYPRNRAFLDWCAAFRDLDGDGLLEYAVADRPFCRCDESGMDNSPRFDAPGRLAAVDFNAFYARECQLMARFARRLGLADDAGEYEVRAEKINELINRRLWNETAGLYCDFDTTEQKPSDVLSSAGFLPLVSGAPDAAKTARMAALLDDPRKFGTPLPLPSVARDSEKYVPDMWRGPVWININYMVAEGFADRGYENTARRIVSATRNAIEKYFRLYGSFYEYYDADDQIPPQKLLRKGSNDAFSVFHQPLRDYGWTAALYADICFQK